MLEATLQRQHTHLWKALPPELAELLRPELGAIADEIVGTIQREIPEFARPLEGQFGVSIRLGVEEALTQFADLIVDPDAPRDRSSKIYRSLGRGELREGRSLDALQAAYRLGARVAWRRCAEICMKADVSAAVMSLLAEAVFAHVDEIAAESVEGFAEAQANMAGSVQRRRQRLLELLLAPSSLTSPVLLMDLAESAQWPLPATAACVAVEDTARDAELSATPLDQAVLVDLERADPYLLVPDPETPGRLDSLRRALRGWTACIGPTVPLGEVARSLRWARETLRLTDRGAIPRGDLVYCDDHLSTMLLLGDEELIELLARRTLAPLACLTPKQRNRFEKTLLAWLETVGGSAREVAARLGVHPQTVRYRMHRIEEFFGTSLQDPDLRFEMEMVLRARVLLQGRVDGEAGDGDD